MASLIELNGMVGRTQDYSTIKQNADNKALVDQSNIHVKQEKQIEKKSNTVRKGDDAQKKENRHDAKEKGNGTYAGDGGQNRQAKDNAQNFGKVTIKGQSHFDVSV